jgi:hypothetical protein
MHNGSNMISIYAKIPSDNTPSISTPTDLETNNVSSNISSVLNTVKDAQDVFLLGVDRLDSGVTFLENNVSYYIGSQVSDENGNFFEGYTIMLESEEPIDSFTITFDTVRNNYPTTITVDGIDVINVYSSTVVLPCNASTFHTIAFSNWSQASAPVVIQGILSGIETAIGASQILNLSFSNADRGDTSMQSWGIYSNSGTLSFVDNANIVSALKMRQRFYKSKLQVFLKNAKSEKLIGTFSLTKGDLNEESKVSEINFADELEKLQDIKVNEKKLITYDNELGMSLEDIRLYVAQHLVDRLGLGDITLAFADDETRIRWQKIWVKYPTVEASSYWAFLTKCCELSGCYVSCDEKGRAMIKYGGGT